MKESNKFTTFATIMKICCIFNIAPLYRKSIYSLMKRELDVDMFFGEYSSEGIAVMQIPASYALKNRHRGTKLVWQRRAIRKAFSKKYDTYILTGNAGILSNWIIALIARLLGRKVYLWSHGLRGNESPTTIRKNMAYFKLTGNALLYGERAQKLLAERGFNNTTVIYNSLDYEKHLEISAKISDDGFLRNYFGNDLPSICYIGRLTPFKELNLLLKAMQNLECNLVIVGGGSAEKGLKNMVVELGVEDKVWFYGESYDDIFIGALLSNCAITVNPSSIGLTAIHSLTFGTPVVTHDDLGSQMPEAEAIIAGITGFYYIKGDANSLQTTIETALRIPKSEDECRKVIAQKYNPKVQIEILKKLFGTDIEHSM